MVKADSHSTHYGTDAFDFSALPGGYRNPNGSFVYIGSSGRWWSSTEYTYTSSHAWFRNTSGSYGAVYRYDYGKAVGLSLRCVRD